MLLRAVCGCDEEEEHGGLYAQVKRPRRANRLAHEDEAQKQDERGEKLDKKCECDFFIYKKCGILHVGFFPPEGLTF